MISQTPQGVAGSMVDWSRHMRPTLTTWNPSTSLVGATALQTIRSSIWSAGRHRCSSWTSTINKPSHDYSICLPGKGSCTRRPSTRWSVLSLSIRSNNSSSLMSECFRIVSLLIPVGGCEKCEKVHWIHVFDIYSISKNVSLLTNVSCGSCLIQDIRVTGRIVPYQDHTQMGSPVTSWHPLLHIGPGLLPDLPC